jgi:two-component system response regulator YesN
MLVDDENTVRNGIRMMIPWEELGLTVIAEAGDGDDGVEKLLAFAPDIVIADIRMPGMNGLQMLEEAMKHGFTGKAVILSGYSDFSYAQAAIALGVKKFILKPVDEDELIAELKRLTEEINNEHKTEFVRKKGSEYLQGELIKSLFLGTATTEQIIESGLPESPGAESYTVALISVNDNNDDIYDYLKGTDNPKYISLDLEHTLGLLFMGYTKTETARFMEKITTEFAAVGETVGTPFDIKESYNSAAELFRMKFLYMHSGVITPDTLKQYWTEGGEPEEIIEKLYALISVNDNAKLTEYMDKLYHIFLSGRYTPETIRFIYVHAANDIIAKTDRNGADNRKANLPTAEDVAKISSLATLFDINLYVTEMFCGISDSVFGDTTQSNIEKIVRYIAANFKSEIRLEGLATLFGYNSAYLGKIFHKYTGENFNNYLDNIRITEAKRLLESKQYKVYEVAEMVGFTNINYFHNKFKKIVGISPMAYKKAETE